MGERVIFVISKVNKGIDGNLYMSAWNEYNQEDAEKSIKQDFRNDMKEKFEDDNKWNMKMLHQSSTNEYYCEIEGEETRWLITRMNV